MEVKTLLCPNCGSADVEMQTETKGKCKSCNSQFVLETQNKGSSDELARYLKLARDARAEGNTEDAKQFYDKVRQADPGNGEAKFFYQYYALYEGKNGEIATRFVSLTKVLKPSVSQIVASNDTEEEKTAILESIALFYWPLPSELHHYMVNLRVGSPGNSQRVLPTTDLMTVWSNGVRGCYTLGDCILEAFPDNKRMINTVLELWKEGVDGQVNHKAMNLVKIDYKGVTAEEYAEKIKKYEPDYTIPSPSVAINGVRLDSLNPKARMRLSYIFFMVFFTLGQAKRDETAKFHANQGLLLFIIEAFALTGGGLLSSINSTLSSIVVIALLAFGITFSVLGVKNVNQDKMKAIPLIGKIRLLK